MIYLVANVISREKTGRSKSLDAQLLRFRNQPNTELAIPLAEGLLLAGRAAEAVEVAEVTLTRLPRSVALLVLHGRASMEDGELLRAQASFLKAARIDLETALPLRWLAEVLLRRGDRPRAKKVFERATGLQADFEGRAELESRLVESKDEVVEAPAASSLLEGLKKTLADASVTVKPTGQSIEEETPRVMITAAARPSLTLQGRGNITDTLPASEPQPLGTEPESFEPVTDTSSGNIEAPSMDELGSLTSPEALAGGTEEAEESQRRSTEAETSEEPEGAALEAETPVAPESTADAVVELEALEVEPESSRELEVAHESVEAVVVEEEFEDVRAESGLSEDDFAEGLLSAESEPEVTDTEDAPESTDSLALDSVQDENEPGDEASSDAEGDEELSAVALLQAEPVFDEEEPEVALVEAAPLLENAELESDDGTDTWDEPSQMADDDSESSHSLDLETLAAVATAPAPFDVDSIGADDEDEFGLGALQAVDEASGASVFSEPEPEPEREPESELTAASAEEEEEPETLRPDEGTRKAGTQTLAFGSNIEVASAAPRELEIVEEELATVEESQLVSSSAPTAMLPTVDAPSEPAEASREEDLRYEQLVQQAFAAAEKPGSASQSWSEEWDSGDDAPRDFDALMAAGEDDVEEATAADFAAARAPASSALEPALSDSQELDLEESDLEELDASELELALSTGEEVDAAAEPSAPAAEEIVISEATRDIETAIKKTIMGFGPRYRRRAGLRAIIDDDLKLDLDAESDAEVLTSPEPVEVSASSDDEEELDVEVSSSDESLEGSGGVAMDDSLPSKDEEEATSLRLEETDGESGAEMPTAQDPDDVLGLVASLDSEDVSLGDGEDSLDLEDPDALPVIAHGSLPPMSNHVSGSRIGRLALWGATLVFVAGLGWFGRTLYIGNMHETAQATVESASDIVLRGDYASLVRLDGELEEASHWLDEPARPTSLRLVAALQRTLEERDLTTGELQERLDVAADHGVDSSLRRAGQAVLHLLGGNSPEARRELSGLMELQTADPAILYLVGRTGMLLDMPEVTARLELAYQSQPRFASAGVALARVRAEAGDTAASREILADLLEIYPDHERVILWSGWLAEEQLAGHLENVTRLADAGELSPAGELFARTVQARLLGRLERMDEARSLSAELRPDTLSHPEFASLAVETALALGQEVEDADDVSADETLLIRLAESHILEGRPMEAFHLATRLDEGASRSRLRGLAALAVATRPAWASASVEISNTLEAMEEPSAELQAIGLRLSMRLSPEEDRLHEARTIAIGASNEPQATYAVVEAALASRDHRTAMSFLSSLEGEARGSVTHQMLHGRALQMAGDTEAAVNAFRGVAEAQPTNAAARVALAGALVQAGNYDEARALYDGLENEPESVEGHPATVSASMGQAELLVAQGRFDEAAEMLDGMPASALESGASLVLRGQLAIARGQSRTVLRELAAAVDAEPRHADLLALYGDALYASGRRDTASVMYERALQVESSHPEALLGLGFTLLRADRLEDAMNKAVRLEAALAERPRSNRFLSRALLLKGRILIREQSRSAAREAVAPLREAVSLPGAPTEAWFFLGESLAGYNSPEARTAYLRYLELEPRGHYARVAQTALGMN